MNECETKTIVESVGKNVCAAPRVSVVIPAYNVSAYIADALDSVFAQTFTGYEIILVNDGSTDTAELKIALAPFFERIVYAEQENAGASQARNSAINLARGEILAFLDGDDVWLPNFLASQIDFLEKNNLEMVYCDALIFGDTLLSGEKFSENSPSSGAVTTTSLIEAKCNVITSGTVLKRGLFEKFGLFDLTMRRGQDFEMWFRLAKSNVRIGCQPEVLLKYRVRAGSLSGTNVERAERDIAVMSRVREKYDLDESERTAWERQMPVYRAGLELEKGKSSLAIGDYAGAQTHLAAANRFYRKPKLVVVNWLLWLSPRLTARLFKTLRPSQFSRIASDKL